MANAASSSDPTLITNYFDKMLEVQSSIKELQKEYQQLLKDAEVDGLERKALNPLMNLLAGETRPQGIVLLNKLVEYSEQAGLELDVVSSARLSAVEAESQPVPETRRWNTQSNLAEEHRLIGDKTAAWLQAIIGLAAGGTFLWLLH